MFLHNQISHGDFRLQSILKEIRILFSAIKSHGERIFFLCNQISFISSFSAIESLIDQILQLVFSVFFDAGNYPMRNLTADAIPLSRNYGTTTPAVDQHGEHHPPPPPPPPPPPKEGSCCHCCKDPNALPLCTLWIWLGFW